MPVVTSGTEFAHAFCAEFSHNSSSEGKGGAPTVRYESLRAPLPSSPEGALPRAGLAPAEYFVPLPGGLGFPPANYLSSGGDPLRSGFYNQGGVYFDEWIEHAFVLFNDATLITGVGGLAAEARRRASEAWLNISTGAMESNGATRALRPATSTVPFARLALNGAAEVFFNVNNFAHATLAVRSRWSPQSWSHARFTEWSGDPDGQDAHHSNVPNLLRQLESLFGNAGGNFDLGGGDILQNCGAAFIHPSRVCFLRPLGDIGPGTDQIPVSVLDNTAAKFRHHPGCFLRRVDYIRDIQAMDQDNDSVVADSPEPWDIAASITAQRPAILLSVLRRPLASRWGFVFDGQYVEHIISHGLLDVRRPKDIWNQVIVPGLAVGNAITRGILTFNPIGVSGPVVNFNTVGELNKLGYLQYAVCLQHYDAEPVTPIYGLLQQTVPLP